MKFEKAFELVVGAEGKYSNDPNDRGNWTTGIIGKGELLGTKYGIAAHVYGNGLLAIGKTIKDLTLDDARAIYKRDYWDVLHLDEMPEIYRYPLFSCAVNCGCGRAAQLFQRVLNVIVDGKIGARTIKAATEFMDSERLLDDFLHEWDSYYDSLVAKDPSKARYINGWHNRIKEVKRNNF